MKLPFAAIKLLLFLSALLRSSVLAQRHRLPPPVSRQLGGVDVGVAEDDANGLMFIPDGGNGFRLGELYDARSDTVVPGLLWERDLIEQNTDTINATFTSTEVLTEDTLRNRAKLLDLSISAALVFKIMPGIELSIKGSFAYMNDKRTSSHSVSMATNYRTRTVRESINAFSQSMLAGTNQFIFGKGDACTGGDSCKLATHFVSSITYGANAIASFETFYHKAEERTAIQAGLAGKLAMPMFEVMVKGDLKHVADDEEIANNTRVKIFGDLKVKSALPTSVDDAIQFMKELPEKTDTLVGRGVPMDIVLTPLAWLDSDAAKLQRRIGGDAIERLAEVYDSFDRSEVLLLDTIALEHGGFMSWKRAIDFYFQKFQEYRSEFSLKLAQAMAAYKSGSNTTALDDILSLEQDYYDENNNFNEAAVTAKCRDEADAISNLLALASEFPKAGVSFVENVGDFFAPTFDTRIDKVYALLIVGSNPSNDRPGIAKVRDFVALSRSKYDPELEPDLDGITHCEFIVVDGKKVCKETMAFLAIHFDSFCDDFCHFPFCPTGIDSICPSTRETPPCEVSDVIAERLNCRSNNYTGLCGLDAEHNIANNEMPLSDCWCSCPKTQILLFESNYKPIRVTAQNMPRVPNRPNISQVVDSSVEDDPFNQALVVNLNPDSGGANQAAYNYLVNIEWTERVVSNNSVSFVVKNQEFYTQDNSLSLPVSGLSAGRTYTFNVAGLNSVGLGLSSSSPLTTVAHRMIDELGICVSPNQDGTCNQPSVVSSRTVGTRM